MYVHIHYSLSRPSSVPGMYPSEEITGMTHAYVLLTVFLQWNSWFQICLDHGQVESVDLYYNVQVIIRRPFWLQILHFLKEVRRRAEADVRCFVFVVILVGGRTRKSSIISPLALSHTFPAV